MKKDAQQLFEQLKVSFKKSFGLEYPPIFLPDPRNEPLSSKTDDYHLACSAAVDDCETFPVIPVNFDAAPRGIWLAGYWGHGVNSYAWYFVRKDARREVFLRLFYGGVYGDEKRDAANVRAFVERYVAFEEWTGGRRFRFVNDMGYCEGWIEGNGGQLEKVTHGLGKEFRFPNEKAA